MTERKPPQRRCACIFSVRGPLVTLTQTMKSEGKVGVLYSLTACLGFVTDAAILTALVHLKMEPAWARLISLTIAMQVTFWVNGLWVFRCISRKGWVGAWLGYMATNSVGNFCNYWTFVTLVSLHHPILSNHWLDLVIGGLVAWSINFVCARFLIFGARKEAGSEAGCTSLSEVAETLSVRFRH
jgi:putative flippase GtrA